MTSHIHDTAVVHPSARLGDVVIGPYCVIEADAVIGDGTELRNHVTLCANASLGKGNVVWPNAVLGGHPQDFKFEGNSTRLEIGDGNVIREGATANVGTEQGGGVTRIGDDNLIMGNAHIAHDCQVGSRCVIGQSVLFAGHVHVEDDAIICGASAMHQFLTVGAGCYVGGMTRLVHDVPPYMIVEGNPSVVRGINAIGLARRGFAEERIEALRKAFRILWRSGLPRAAAIEKIAATLEQTSEIATLIAFLQRTAEGKHGRYLEKFR